MDWSVRVWFGSVSRAVAVKECQGRFCRGLFRQALAVGFRSGPAGCVAEWRGAVRRSRRRGPWLVAASKAPAVLIRTGWVRIGQLRTGSAVVDRTGTVGPGQVR